MQKIVICHNASEATAASAVTLKNTLEQCASQYFDSFELATDGTETVINCKIGNVTAFQIVYNASNHAILRAAGIDIHVAHRESRSLGIYNVYVMDNAIAFEYGYFEGYFELNPEAIFFLCKRSDRKTAVVYFTNSDDRHRYMLANPGEIGICIISIDRETGSENIGESPHYRKAGTSDVTGYTPFSSVDGITVKDVFVNGRTGFGYNYNNNVPFEYSLNGETFTAFRGNCICVKGT